MKHTFTTTLLLLSLLSALHSFSQWTLPNGLGNINNTNSNNVGIGTTVPNYKLHLAGRFGLDSMLDQGLFNPPGGTLLVPGTTFAQVNANFGGLVVHSSINTPAAMNSFWGQNFDYHNNGDIKYRINGPGVMQQFANGNIYFYTAPTGTARNQIDSFKFTPKLSLANNGGFAIGSTYAIANMAASGNLLVEKVIGLGTQSPSAQLHTTGTVRFQGITTGGSPTNLVAIDANGNLFRYSLSTGIQNNCATLNYLTKTGSGGNLNCSQVFDDGTSVGINQSSGFAYSGLTVVGSTIPPTTGTSRLAVNGVTTSVAFYATSDERMKANIINIERPMNIIKKLQGKSYVWNATEIKTTGVDGGKQLGFLAQDLAKIIPEVVIKKDDGTYAVNYDGIIPVLTEGIKAQQQELESLQADIITLQNELHQLRQQVKTGRAVTDQIDFTISPNPATQQAILQYSLPQSSANTAFIITDLQGKLIRKITVPTNTQKGNITISRDNLPNGVYLLSLTSGSAEIQTKKIILAQ